MTTSGEYYHNYSDEHYSYYSGECYRDAEVDAQGKQSSPSEERTAIKISAEAHSDSPDIWPDTDEKYLLGGA